MGAKNPNRGVQVTVQLDPETWAAEVIERWQGCEEKSGSLGTWGRKPP